MTLRCDLPDSHHRRTKEDNRQLGTEAVSVESAKSKICGTGTIARRQKRTSGGSKTVPASGAAGPHQLDSSRTATLPHILRIPFVF